MKATPRVINCIRTAKVSPQSAAAAAATLVADAFYRLFMMMSRRGWHNLAARYPRGEVSRGGQNTSFSKWNAHNRLTRHVQNNLVWIFDLFWLQYQPMSTYYRFLSKYCMVGTPAPPLKALRVVPPVTHARHALGRIIHCGGRESAAVLSRGTPDIGQSRYGGKFPWFARWPSSLEMFIGPRSNHFLPQSLLEGATQSTLL